jgi:PLP dependent protein
VLLQVNTSGEDAKSGLPPLTPSANPDDAELVVLARHVLASCPRLRLQGLMTIGSLSESLAQDKPNQDFETLKQTRDALQDVLNKDTTISGKWGDGGKLLLSMGMSSDFEAALSAGSDIVRVGTGIFGERHKKGES